MFIFDSDPKHLCEGRLYQCSPPHYFRILT